MVHQRIRLILPLLMPVVFLVAPGCQPHSETPTPAAKKDSEPPSFAAHVERGKAKRRAENDLKQIALFYQTYLSDQGKAPANVDAFASYIRRDAPTEAKLLQDGQYVLCFPNTMSSDKVLVYEKEVDLNGNQVVAMADGSVKTVKAGELSGMLKAQGR